MSCPGCWPKPLTSLGGRGSPITSPPSPTDRCSLGPTPAYVPEPSPHSRRRKHGGRSTHHTGLAPLSDLLPRPPTDDGTSLAPQPKPAKRLRGHSLQAEHAFDRSLTHARVYHQWHGHLAVPKEDVPDDYPLGAWLSNLRTRHTRMPTHQAAALHALYPWWNAPWSTLWQRTWHQARDHAETHGPLEPASGFPTTRVRLQRSPC